MLKISAYFSKLSNLAYTDRSNIMEGQVLWQPSSGQVPEENKSVLTQWAIKRFPLFAHHLLGKNCQAVWHIIWRNTAMAMPLVWAIPALHPPPREQQSHCQDSSKAALVHAWRESSCMWKEGSHIDLGLHTFLEPVADVTGAVLEQSCSIQRWWDQI